MLTHAFVIFVDSNVPMYLAGAHYPNKTHAMELVDGLIRGGERDTDGMIRYLPRSQERTPCDTSRNAT